MARGSQSFTKLLKQKQGFLLSVYGTLIVELMITFFIVYGFRNHPALSNATKQSLLTYVVVSLALIFILSMVRMPVWLKLIVFTLFSIVTGALLHNATVFLPAATINQALIGAICIFLALSIVGIVLAALGYDLSWMVWMLLAGLVGLLVAHLILIFLDKNKTTTKIHRILIYFGLVLFSMYIMYETNIMLGKDYSNDFVSAAIDLYLDFVNVFTRLLALDSE